MHSNNDNNHDLDIYIIDKMVQFASFSIKVKYECPVLCSADDNYVSDMSDTVQELLLMGIDCTTLGTSGIE